MKWQRCTTATPGQPVSTMNAVICRFSFPFTTLEGVRAITTINSALVPLVHHSFSPFRSHACPSWVGTASVSIAAGSDRKSTRLNSSHLVISYAVFCLKKKKYNTGAVVLYSDRHP